MPTTTTHEQVNTHALREGDIVLNAGMRIQLGERKISASHPVTEHGGECVYFHGAVLE